MAETRRCGRSSSSSSDDVPGAEGPNTGSSCSSSVICYAGARVRKAGQLVPRLKVDLSACKYELCE